MKRTQTAFTLMELMVSLTVLGILLGLAVPTFRDFTRNNRTAALHNDLTTAFTLARSEALKRSMPVSICASTDGTACATDDDWSAGWIVFTDGNGTAGSVDAPDTVLQVWTASAGGDVSIDTDQDFIQYGPTGSVIPDSASTFDVVAQGCSGDRARRLGVSPTGSLTPSKIDCP
jgi:type IV fimbrial biogenesis protein FimT